MSTNDGGPAFPVPGNPATMPGITEDAQFAYLMADAMLAARERTTT